MRGGSKSIPKKNIKPLLGRPLCDWAIRSCLDAGIFDQVYVATDDIEIETTARQSGANIFHRSAESASDAAPTSMVIDEFIQAHPDVQTVYLVQATSPLTTPAELQESFIRYQETQSTGLVTCTRQHHFRWDQHKQTPLNYDPTNRPRRQDWDGELYEDGSFYVLDIPTYRQNQQIPTGDKILVYELERSRHLEIDDPIDFVIFEQLMDAGVITGYSPE